MNSSGSSSGGFVSLPQPSSQIASQTTSKQDHLRSENIQTTSLPQRSNSNRQMKGLSKINFAYIKIKL